MQCTVVHADALALHIYSFRVQPLCSRAQVEIVRLVRREGED